MSKKPIKICHLADLHLGYRRYTKLDARGFNQRESDVNQAFHEAVDRLIQLKPDLVVIAGDIFDSVRPSNSVLAFAFKELRRLAESIKVPVVIIAGNHDTPKRIDSGSPLKILKEIEGIYVADAGIEKFSFPDINTSVTCIPHSALIEKQNKIPGADDRFDYNILLLHAQIGEEWISDFGGADFSLKQIVAGEWDYIALGHVHVNQDLAINASYAGSLEHTSRNIWAESEYNKGFLEVLLPSGRKNFYSLTAPREVLSLPVCDVAGLTAEEVDRRLETMIEEIAGGINGKIIRISLKNLPALVYRQLDHRQIRKWRVSALNLMLEYTQPEQVVSNAPRKFKSLAQELKDFCQSNKTLVKDVDNTCLLIEQYLNKLEVQNETP